GRGAARHRAARGQGGDGCGDIPARRGTIARAGALVPRYCLKLEYDGTPFAGWQRQADALSVQQVVEEAIEKMSGEKVAIQAAGRTDSGVHALGQVVSFDLSRDWDPFK